jgi:hypothetical protein
MKNYWEIVVFIWTACSEASCRWWRHTSHLDGMLWSRWWRHTSHLDGMLWNILSMMMSHFTSGRHALKHLVDDDVTLHIWTACSETSCRWWCHTSHLDGMLWSILPMMMSHFTSGRHALKPMMMSHFTDTQYRLRQVHRITE